MKTSLNIFLLLFVCLGLTAQADTTQPEPIMVEEIASYDVIEAGDFENINQSVKKPGSAKLQWNLTTKNLDPSTKLVIEVKESLKKNDDYTRVAEIDASEVNYTVEGLKGNTKYKWKVGAITVDAAGEEVVVYAKSGKFTTKSPWNLWAFFKLLGSLGIFIFGMKIMSDGIQKAAGKRLRSVMAGITNNRFSGVIAGFLTTATVQSSSATTVMVVSFVNAGLLTLAQSIGVIMGANIGTTVTGWLIAELGFKVSISYYALIAVAFAFPLLFTKKNNLKSIGEFVLGFAILFIGLDFLKGSVPDIKGNQEALAFLQQFTDLGYLSIMLFVGIGTLLTVVIQSSSATMAVTLVLLSQGVLEYEHAAAMVLGENIGTTITANLAAIVGNVHAKRAARFHFFFNILGVIWMLIVFKFYIAGIQNIGGQWGWDNERQLAIFHTSFNILNMLLLIGFVPMLEKLVIRIQKSTNEEDEEFRLKYLQAGMMSTPEISIAETKKAMQSFAKLIDKMIHGHKALMFENPKNAQKIVDKIYAREEITDDMELEIANFISKLSQGDLTAESSKRLQSLLGIANDLERIADIIYEMTRNYERMIERKINYPEDAVAELSDLMDSVLLAIKLMRDALAASPQGFDMNTALEIEKQINDKRKEIRQNHYERLDKGIYTPRSGVIYLDFANRLERIGDHIVNVHEAINDQKI